MADRTPVRMRVFLIGSGLDEGDAVNETDLAILAFEDERWRYAGNKERMIQERFGLTPNQYYQRLNRLLDEPEALEQQPALVNRLLRLRDARERRRCAPRAH